VKNFNFLFKIVLFVIFSLPVVPVAAQEEQMTQEEREQFDRAIALSLKEQQEDKQMEMVLEQSRQAFQQEEENRKHEEEKRKQEANDYELAIYMQFQPRAFDEAPVFIEEQPKPEHKRGQRGQVFNEQPTSLVWQFIKRNAIEEDESVKDDPRKLKDLEVGESYDLVKDKRCTIQRLTKDVVVIQLPVVPQKGARCGSHALLNSKLLCEINDIDWLMESLNSREEVDEEIGDNSKTIKNIRKEAKNYVKKNKLLSADYERYANTDSMVSYEEMLGFNGNNMCAKIGSVHRTIFKFDSPENLVMQKVISDACNRFKKNLIPEVFIVNTGGHWIAMRVERMQNGMVGILLLDSIWSSGEKVVDKIEIYRRWLTFFTNVFVV